MKKIQSPFIIKNQLKASVGASIIIIGFIFIVNGSGVIKIGDSFVDNVLIERLSDEKDIDYHDNADQVKWIHEFRISQTDSSAKVVGMSLGLNGYIEIRESPQEIALHIFHEDADVYFTSDEEFHYRAITKNLERVPSLRYGDIYSIEFNMDDLSVGKESSAINGFSNIEFTKHGTYFAQVSAKLQNGTIIHYHSNTSVFTISDKKQEWIVNALDTLIKSEEDTKPLMITSFGWTVIAIGIGLIISGISLFVGATEKRLSVVERLKSEFNLQ